MPLEETDGLIKGIRSRVTKYILNEVPRQIASLEQAEDTQLNGSSNFEESQMPTRSLASVD